MTREEILHGLEKIAADEGLYDDKKPNRELEQLKGTAKNNLGVDCISRDSAIKALGYDIRSFEFKSGVSKHMDDIAKLLNTIYEIQVNNIKALPPVTPQEPCEDWRKISVYKVETDEKVAQDIKKFLELNNQPLITSVLPTEPKVEVIGINEVLDKISAEIKKYECDCRLTVDDYTCSKCTDNVFNSIYGILDKCKAESEKE